MAAGQSQGLYSPRFEHDSCGFGLIASIDDTALKADRDRRDDRAAPTYSPRCRRRGRQVRRWLRLASENAQGIPALSRG